MSRLEILTEVNPSAWNEDVKKLKSCPFHAYEWSLFSANANSATPLYLRWVHEDGDIWGLGIGLEKRRNIAGFPFSKTLSLGSFPALNGLLSPSQMMDSLVSYCRQHGFSSLVINSFGTPHETEILPVFGFTVSKRWEFLVNLNKTEEGLWNTIHTKKRNLIRKGQKQGLRVRRAFDSQDIMQFRDLAFETYKRKTELGVSFPRPAEKTYYRFLKEQLMDTGLGRLYMAYDAERPVSGAFFVGFHGTAYYMLSSASKEGLRKAAPDVVLWTSMTEYLKEGYQIFNLGGLSEKELEGQPLEKSGLYHFKKRFSADVHECWKGELVQRPVQHQLYNFMRKTKSKFLK